ncbi:MAG TPA: DUF3883 domain-containing protein [Ignavibacteria bacterium]
MGKYIFLRIAWMKYYQGVKVDDIPTGAGSWVEEHHDGGEVYNFLPFEGRYYGFARIQNDRKLTLERLGAKPQENYVDNITIVFFAKNPQTGGQYIVGWYKNAKLYREVQRLQNGLRLNRVEYLAQTLENDSYLIPDYDRFFEIPVDGPGQTNAWYIENYKNPEYLKEVQNYINDPVNYIFRKKKRYIHIHQPWQKDIELKKEVEIKAINTVTEYFEDRNFIVQNKCKDNLGWDLEASLRNQALLLEVKGLSADFTAIELTPNEYSNSRINKKHYRICIVSNVLNEVMRKLEIYYWDKDKWISNENKMLEIQEKTSAICISKN